MNLFSGRTGDNYESECPHYDTREEQTVWGDSEYIQWYTVCNTCGRVWTGEDSD